MVELPFLRMTIVSSLVTFVTGTIGYAVCVRTGSLLWTMVGTSIFVAIGLFFVLRWWSATKHAAGIPHAFASASVAIQSAFLIAIGTIGTIALEVGVFAISGSRLIEAFVAVVIGAPVGYLIMRRTYTLMRPPTPSDASLSRFNYMMYLAVSVAFLICLSLQLLNRHPYASLDDLRNQTIAACMLLVPLNAIASYFTYRRYALARTGFTART